MREIALTKGAIALVDDEDYAVISSRKWMLESKGYAGRFEWSEGKKRFQFMHRAILGVTDPKIKVDHVNGNTVDNRRSNLRLCSDSQNMMNRGMQANNSSGFKGVTWNKHCKKWQSQIVVKGKRFYLGVFCQPEDAYAAYVMAALRMHGEFVNLGDPK